MYQIDCEDANFLFLDKPDSPAHISLLSLYDQSDRGEDVVRFTELRQHLQDRLSSAWIFRRKVERVPGDIDYPYWVDDQEFDLDFHIRHLALPKPGDWRQFCIQVARLHSRPLDLSRPLWELYVIEGLDNVENFPSNCFALYLKVHHCAMDEFTAQELLLSLHSQKPGRTEQQHVGQFVTRPTARAPKKSEMLLRGVVNNITRSSRLLIQSAGNFRQASRWSAKFGLRMAQKTLDRDSNKEQAAPRFGRDLGTARVFEGGFYDKGLLEEFARKVPGSTLTHAILTLCGEAMRSYLDKHGEWNEMPLQALLEVDVRNAGAHALVGNHIAVNRVACHASLEYPVNRLQAVYLSAKNINDRETAERTSIKLRSLYENVPAPLMAWLGKNAKGVASFTRHLLGSESYGLVEMQGPEEPVYLLGAKLLGFTGISPLYRGCGLMFCASTYLEQVCLTFSSDRGMLPDPLLMRECLDEAFTKIELCLVNKH